MAAAPILSWEGLSLQQGSGWLFRDLDLAILPRDRLALIGRNGAGKTTLLRLISGEIEADRGKRSIQPGTKIVVLEQDPFFTGHATLMDFALHGPDAPPRHEVESIAGQLGIDMNREAASASGGERRCAAPLPPSPTSCCWTSRPTTSTWRRSTGSRAGWAATPAPSSSSAMTAPSSNA